MKPSMFCHYAHCTSNKAGFHKAAARSHLDRLLRTDWMCHAEWVAPVKCLEPEDASARISVIRSFIYLIFFFDDHRVICISHEGRERVASVRCHSCSSCWNARGRSRKPFEERKNQRGSTSLSEKHSARPRSWNPRGRSVARPAGLGCRRRLAKAGHVKKKKDKKKNARQTKTKAKEKSKLTWVWHKSGLAFDSCAWEAEPRSSSHKIGSHSGLWQVPLKAMLIMDVKHPAFRFQRRKALSPL